MTIVTCRATDLSVLAVHGKERQAWMSLELTQIIASNTHAVAATNWVRLGINMFPS